jgi:hypothetical protein
MRSTPLYAPDGMAGGEARWFQFEAVHAHERHDDGLVHNHNWAASDHRETAAPVWMPAIRTFAGSIETTRFDDDDRYDDGLVHNHHWAVSGK